MDELDGVLAMELLTLASEQIQPYALAWLLGRGGSELAECTVLVIMRRAGGILLAIPKAQRLYLWAFSGARDACDAGRFRGGVPNRRCFEGQGHRLCRGGGRLPERAEEVVYAYNEDSPLVHPSML